MNKVFRTLTTLIEANKRSFIRNACLFAFFVVETDSKTKTFLEDKLGYFNADYLLHVWLKKKNAWEEELEKKIAY